MPQDTKREKSEEQPNPIEQKPEGLARVVASRGNLDKQISGRIQTDEELRSSLSLMQTFQMRQYLSRYQKMNSQQQLAEQGKIAMNLFEIDMKAGDCAKRGLHRDLPKIHREAAYWDLIARVIPQRK